MAFYAEVVVALRGKRRLAGAALQQSLGESDGGGDAVSFLLLYGHLAVGVDIFLIRISFSRLNSQR